MELVTLTIDGRQLSVPKGTSVLRAAIEAGIQVPYYCYHPGLGIDASCRVCLVKIEKMPKLQTSCSTPVAEGMWATWCKNCLTMDKTTLANQDVEAALSGYVRIKFRAEDPDQEPAKAVMQRFNAVGLPAYVILRPKS